VSMTGSVATGGLLDGFAAPPAPNRTHFGWSGGDSRLDGALADLPERDSADGALAGEAGRQTLAACDACHGGLASATASSAAAAADWWERVRLAQEALTLLRGLSLDAVIGAAAARRGRSWSLGGRALGCDLWQFLCEQAA
jgi:hypothetical protein